MPSKKKKPYLILLLLGAIVLFLVFLGTWKFIVQHNNDSQQHLSIKEWGVGFALPKELRGDIYYKITYPEGGDVARATFYSKRLDTQKSACTYYDHRGIGVFITRSPSIGTAFPYEEGRAYKDGVLTSGDLVAINKHNYTLSTSYDYPQDLCHQHTSDKSDPIWPEAKKIHDDLHKAVLTLEQMN